VDRLIVCEGCKRHVKEHDAECPFCKRRLPVPLLAVGAFAASIALAACGSAYGPPPDNFDAAYGPPPGYEGGSDDSGSDAATDAPKDTGADGDASMMGAYGPPPPQDAGDGG